jgi:hypothetical protein
VEVEAVEAGEEAVAELSLLRSISPPAQGWVLELAPERVQVQRPGQGLELAEVQVQEPELVLEQEQVRVQARVQEPELELARGLAPALGLVREREQEPGLEPGPVQELEQV